MTTISFPSPLRFTSISSIASPGTPFTFGRYLIALLMSIALLLSQNNHVANANGNPPMQSHVGAAVTSSPNNIDISGDILLVGGIALVVLMLSSICAMALTRRGMSEQ